VRELVDRGNMFERFLHSQAVGSMVLILATVVALVWANSSWAPTYFELYDTYLGFSFGEAEFKLSLSHWIKDGLMAIFFFVVGLEIKREIVVGELSRLDRAMLPVCAALGGAIAPAAFYALLNWSGPGQAGWGIPMATDIAFALGVLSLFGKRVPIGLKVFLTALAIADDLLAVAVIAVFYTPRLELTELVLAVGGMFSMLVFNKAGIRATWVYATIAALVWAAVLGSGVHATVAGVMIAMMIPVRPAIDPGSFLSAAESLLREVRGTDNSLEALIHDSKRRNRLTRLSMFVEDATPPATAMEHALQPYQSLVILPLFALFSAGVAFNAENLADFPTDLSLGIMVGLVLGKPIGVLVSAWLVIRLAKLDLEGVTLTQLFGAGCLAGIGFTMSIFISELAFDTNDLVDQAKVGTLIASLISGILGAAILQKVLPRR
jgi:NhaA family Na+:H+ antiporter